MSYLDISTWEQTFQELMEQEKPWAKWSLKLNGTILPGHTAPGWKQYQQTAFGRFWCSLCHRSWSSAQVKILCHMYREPGKSQGQVLMRVFAQRCQKCSWSQFEKPEFSTESIKRILQNLIQYILWRYYGHDFRKMPMIREVPLNGPHDTNNCEACTLGSCTKGSLKQTAKPSTFPTKICCSSPQMDNVLFEEPV
uniref:Receptor-transporting protein 4 n=1 Tax=Castor canadensis TaxID=51338 RepID=A0A8B7V4M3_CASCN